MKAIVVERHGGPEVLQVVEREDPSAGPGQLLVEVEAAGVNYMDIYGRQGNPAYGGEVPFVPGAEGAGRVAAVGEGVSGFAPGDTVAWSGVPGSYAEMVAVPAEVAVAVPAGVDATLAAAVMLQGMTAHYLCHTTYPVAPGEVVVVHAAAGGVGLLLTQMVKMRGGVVVATTSSDAKDSVAREAGADHLTRYERFASVVDDVTGGEGAAAVYDGVGAATFDAGLACLRPRGYMVLYGAASGPVPPLDLTRLVNGGSLFVTRPSLRHYVARRQELQRRSGDLFTWIGEGRLAVRVGATYPLGDAARAHEDLAARRTTGKLLLLPR
ncbi:MAG TPA: quinone oxidoreductase [Acidimicrobiales bacterium]|nr:quinone oxidoreductase [Acidimicrobiales bacterium]